MQRAEGELLDVINLLAAQPQSVMLMAHNPGLSDLEEHSASEINRMPTCAVTELMFAAAVWDDVGEAKSMQVAFDSPKNV